MNFNVKATHFQLTEQVSDYLDKKLVALNKFIENPETVHGDVELARDTHHSKGEVFRAEITLEVPHGFFRVSEEGETVYSAIDFAQAEMLKELSRSKSKRRSLIRWGGAQLKEFTQGISTRGTSMKEYLRRFKGKR